MTLEDPDVIRPSVRAAPIGALLLDELTRIMLLVAFRLLAAAPGLLGRVARIAGIDGLRRVTGVA